MTLKRICQQQQNYSASILLTLNKNKRQLVKIFKKIFML